MTKKCYKCKETKPLTEFYTSIRDGHSTRCKACEKIYNHERYMRDKHLPCIYYIPEMHYIGISSNIKRRINEHRTHHNSLGLDDIEILCYFEREVDAQWLEIQFHQRGYNGFRKL